MAMLCPQCKRPVLLPAATLREYGYGASFDVEGYEPVGCKHCSGSGYRGRTGIYEVMTVTEPIRALILERGSVDTMVTVAEREGMRRMRDDGMDKVREGVTSIAEVERMTTTLL